MGESSSVNKVSKIEAIPLNDEEIVAIIITDKGHVENKKIQFEERVSVEEIKQTVDIINKLIVGTPIDEVSAALEFEVKPIIGKYVKQHEAIYNAFYNAFTDFVQDPVVKMSGTKNILMQPEFDDTNKIREIISKFEDKDIVSNIKENKNGVNVYIGSESEFDDDVSIIKTHYNLNGEEGTLALIGPKRMEYDRVITLLNYIMENIDK